MSSSFTPGPWVAQAVDEDGTEWEVIKHDATKFYPDEPWFIALVYDGADGGDIAANARLIAAAPELLEALRGAIGALEFSRDYHGDLGNEDQAFAQDRLDAATKAILKATGGEA